MDNQTNFMTHDENTTTFIETDESVSPSTPSKTSRDAKPSQASDAAIEVSNTYTATSYNECDCETESEYSEYLSEANQFLAF